MSFSKDFLKNTIMFGFYTASADRLNPPFARFNDVTFNYPGGPTLFSKVNLNIGMPL